MKEMLIGPPAPPPNRTSHSTVHFAIIALLGLLLYSNTFQVPFYLDDFDSIVKNPTIRGFSYFTDPTKTESPGFYNIYHLFRMRPVGYFSFALNHKFHGLEVAGYHALNLAIHVLNSLLLYLLVTLTLRTPVMSGSKLGEYSSLIALFSGLLFLTHPVQTQAVTYITQRFASLATMFYLITMVSYIKSRLSIKRSQRIMLYALSLLSALLAMKTKEISFTLPLAAALYEFSFFRDTLRRRLPYLIPLLLAMAVIPLEEMRMQGSSWTAILQTGRTEAGISRWEYLFAQPRVMATYIRLLFLPVGQNLDYDYPLHGSFPDPGVVSSFLLLPAAFAFIIHLYLRSRVSEAGLRLAAFGGAFFFLTLSVESSIIPLDDLIFEHRVYLPSAGFITAFVVLSFTVAGRARQGRPLAAALVVLTLVLSTASYARNTLWKEEVRLWEDVVKKSPGKARAHNNLGLSHAAEGDTEKAIRQYLTALRLDPEDETAHNSLGSAYISLGRTEEAMAEFRRALVLAPEYAEAHYNLGCAYMAQGRKENALMHFEAAVGLRPALAKAHNNLGLIYESKGLVDKALGHYLAAVEAEPALAAAHFNLGFFYLEVGDMEKARREFLMTLKLEPGYPQAAMFLRHTASKTK
jgi:tetratricopeptide (TPR) repeat protein